MKDILHCDLNNFFASVECLVNPDLKNVPVAVCGKVEERRGIVLAKNQLAKECGVMTGMRNFEAKKLCPDLVILSPNFNLYNKYSEKVREIYQEYTNVIETFGIDEAWLDITASKMFGTPEEIANIIRERVFKEIGLTISVGVSFNKVFAKIGSDLKKPNAVTVIDKENFKDIVWKLKIDNMLGVGRVTRKKLNRFGVYTIGELAKLSEKFLSDTFGKNGKLLYRCSNGTDDTPVKEFVPEVKSVGNSITFYKDLKNNKEVLTGFTILAESICERMCKGGLPKARTLRLTIKDNQLRTFSKQCKFDFPADCSEKIIRTAERLFLDFYQWENNIRLLGISVCDFLRGGEQLSFFGTEKERGLDDTVLSVRKKFGAEIISRGNRLFDKKLGKPLERDIF